MLLFRSGMFVVGPESAGAHPGPTCYRKGGPLTVTDANLMLGRIMPQYFPKIFGPKENEPLDKESTQQAFGKLANEVFEVLTIYECVSYNDGFANRLTRLLQKRRENLQ